MGDKLLEQVTGGRKSPTSPEGSKSPKSPKSPKSLGAGVGVEDPTSQTVNILPAQHWVQSAQVRS